MMVVQVNRRGDANRLVMAIPGDGTRIQRSDGHWEVAIRFEASMTTALEDAFAVIGGWMAACDLSSCRIGFGDSQFTFLQPLGDHSADSAETLLERTVQLQIALDSRVAIDMATGFVAGNMDVSFDDAFSLLRESARSRRIPIDQLAANIIETRDAAPPPDDGI